MERSLSSFAVVDVVGRGRRARRLAVAVQPLQPLHASAVRVGVLQLPLTTSIRD